MPPDPFPEQPDASRLFARNGVIDAVLSFTRLPRFAACLADPEGQVSVYLDFGHDEESRRRLQGTLNGTVKLACQRCLQPMPLQLDCRLDLLVLDSEAALEELGETDAIDKDAVVDATGELDLLAVLEDELILSLPMVPLHEDTSCNQGLNSLVQETGRAASSNPFAVLAALKQNGKN
jgi:uncharacterized protein